MTELPRIASADPSSISAIGHGGGGLQAMLFAMRNRNVRALVNVDAANFSQRSRPRDLPFYSPRLMRAPFLFIATAATKKGLDQFEDFTAMKFSPRTEVILESPNLRHHDLSDLGRGVTAPLALRGEAQAEVQDQYARVHSMIARFLLEHGVSAPAAAKPFAEWVYAERAVGNYTVAFHPAVTAAPTLAHTLNTLDDSTPALLRSARERDPNAPLFQRASLMRVVSKALAGRRYPLAEALSEFAAEVHPDAPIFQASRSAALEGRGDETKAMHVASACAAMPAGNDWQSTVAINACRDRVTRLATQDR